MPERTSVGTRSGLGVETTAGVGVPSNKLFDSFTVMVTPKENTRDFTGQGNKFPSYMQYTYGEVEAAIAGWPSYVSDVYLWSGLFGAATIAAIGVGSHSWTWNPNATDVDTPKTYTVEVGSSVRAGKFTYGQMTDIGWTWDRSGKIDLTGKMTGQQYQDGITLTSSPTLVPDVPFAAVDYQVYLDTTSAGLGGTRLTRVTNASLSLSGKYKPFYPSDRTQQSYTVMVEQPYKIEHKLTLEADSNGMGLLNYIRAGQHLWLRHEFQGAVMPGESTFHYLYQHDSAVAVSAVSEIKDDGGVMGWDVTLTTVYDATWGKAQVLLIQNQLASL